MRTMRTLLFSAVILGVAASPAAAKLYKEHEDVAKAAQKSGKLVLLVYIRTLDFDTRNPSDKMAKYMLQQASGMTRMYEVAVIDPDRNRMLLMTKFVPAMRAKRRISKGDTLLLPLWVVATPEAEFLEGGDYDTIKKAGRAAWRARVYSLAKKYPRISETALKRAEKILAKAKEDLAKKRYMRAYGGAKSVAKIWFPQKFVAARKELVVTIDEKGVDELEKADDLNTDGKFLEAALAYARIKRRFTMKLPAGPKAARKLNALLRQQKGIKEQFDRACQDEEAQELLEDAREYTKNNDTAKARTAYRQLLSRYAETPSAILAKDEMAKLGLVSKKPTTPKTSDDPGKTTDKPKTGDDPSEKEAKAAKLVRLAKTYRASGLKAKAMDKLKLCIKTYPDTKAAEEAKTLLEKWRLEGK